MHVDKLQYIRISLRLLGCILHALIKIVDDPTGSSSDGCCESLSDDDLQTSSISTPAENYLWGLERGKQYSRRNVVISVTKERGRSAFAARDFEAGAFVCEYASQVTTPNDSKFTEERNAVLGIGSYCLDAVLDGKEITFDASTRINDPGR